MWRIAFLKDRDMGYVSLKLKQTAEEKKAN